MTGAARRRETWLLRALIVGLASVAAVLGWRIWRRDHPPDVQVFDLGERARRLAAGSPDADTLADWYYDEAGGSAHLHVFGKGITCQLHIHERTEEASIPVMGRPIVTHRFGSNGVVVAQRRPYDEGMMVVSPPNCAHEWVNPSAADDHASLVFTLGGSFPGNLFVRSDDPRILKGDAPFVVDPLADLAVFAGTGRPARETPVPVEQGTVSEILIKDSFAVEGSDRTVTFVYAVAGTGRVEGLSDEIALAPKRLIVLRRSPKLKVVADPGPLALFLVRIRRVEP